MGQKLLNIQKILLVTKQEQWAIHSKLLSPWPLDLVETEEDIIGEKENFAYNDEDKDGSLNRAEVLKWVSPDMKGVAGEEASHLIQETDSDKDGAVTLEEIYAESDLWVGSEASDVVMTDWEHDEL